MIFFSDNGGLSTLEGPHTPATTNHPLRSGKGWLYEGGIREPLIVRWPGVTPPGRACAVPVISDDVFPTIVEILGKDLDEVAPRRRIDGTSLLGLLRDPSGRAADRALHWHYPHYPRQGSRPAGAVRSGRYKLIEHYEDGAVELFDPRSGHRRAARPVAGEARRRGAAPRRAPSLAGERQRSDAEAEPGARSGEALPRRLLDAEQAMRRANPRPAVRRTGSGRGREFRRRRRASQHHRHPRGRPRLWRPELLRSHEGPDAEHGPARSRGDAV